MTLSLPIDTPKQASANDQAQANWHANGRALQKSCPELVDHKLQYPDGPWIFARDGSLTARPSEQWLEGCSVPLAAARQAMTRATITGTVGCLVLPGHAATIIGALERLRPRQALICIVRQISQLGWILGCADFSDALESDRLFFVSGDDWQKHLQRLLDERPGLPIPTQFLRTPWADERQVAAMIEQAQHIFTTTTRRRTHWMHEQAQKIRATPPRAGAATDGTSTGSVALYAPTHFRLWDDGGWQLHQLTQAAFGGKVRVCDPDRPTQATPISLAQASDGCAALLALNLGRSDGPTLFAPERPWITWITNGRIPPPSPESPNDRLLLADPCWRPVALSAGWDERSVRTALVPAMAHPSAQNPGPLGLRAIASRRPIGNLLRAATVRERFLSRSPLPDGRGSFIHRPSQTTCDCPALGLIADLPDLSPSEQVREMSSQRLLWETIRDGLLDDPLAMGDNPEQFLRTKAKRHGIDLSSIDVANWLIALVVPAWQAGLARQLVADGIRIQIHGSGWSQIEQVDGSVCGPIIERSEWVEAVRASVGLVHLWPTWPGHPVIHSGKPLLVPWRMTRSAWLNAAKALVSKGQTMQPGVDVGCDAMLSAPLLRELAGV